MTAMRSPIVRGLGLVVGDVQRGDAELALQCRDLRTGLHTELCIEVGERLIHEEDLRLANDCTAHGDALALATGESLRLAVEELGEIEDLGGLLNALANLVLRGAGDLQAKPMLSATVMCGYSA